MDNDYDNENYNNNLNSYYHNSIISYCGIIIILFLSIGSQCVKCKKEKNYNNKELNQNLKEQLNSGIIKECSICLSNIDLNNKFITLSCNHSYHDECLNKWFEKSKTCPICRINL